MTPSYEPPKMPKTAPAKSCSSKLTRQEVIKELRNMFMFNYTLVPDEVFRTAIRAVQLAPDDLFKKEVKKNNG